MEVTQKSDGDPQSNSCDKELLSDEHIKREPDIGFAQTEINKTEADVSSIVKAEAPNESETSDVEIDITGSTDNDNISDGAVSEGPDKTVSSQKRQKLSKKSPKSKSIMHVCQACDARFDRFRTLEVHMSYRHGDAKNVPHVCKMCEMSFKWPSALRLHVARAHYGSRTSKKTSCPHCFKTFNTIEALQGHIKRMHVIVTPGATYYCKECHDTFRSKRILRRHAKLKHPQNYDGDREPNVRRVKCKLCRRNFKHRYHFREHYEATHLDRTSARRFPCHECASAYRHRASLYGHVRRKHNKYMCDVCPRSFELSRALQKHRTRSHETKFTCNECSASFASKPSLVDHIHRRHPAARVPCARCDATFSCAGALDRHNAAAHSKTPSTFPCEDCGRAFKWYSTLSYHRMMVHNQEIVCPVCGIKFATPKSLMGHNIVHARRDGAADVLRVFVCDYCQTAYKSKTSLVGHIGRHLGRSPSEFECKVCSQLFVSKSSLYVHGQTKHKPSGQRLPPEPSADPNRGSADAGGHIKCFKCDETFRQGRLFRKHMTYDHKLIMIYR